MDFVVMKKKKKWSARAKTTIGRGSRGKMVRSWRTQREKGARAQPNNAPDCGPRMGREWTKFFPFHLQVKPKKETTTRYPACSRSSWNEKGNLCRHGNVRILLNGEGSG